MGWTKNADELVDYHEKTQTNIGAAMEELNTVEESLSVLDRFADREDARMKIDSFKEKVHNAYITLVQLMSDLDNIAGV